MMGLDDGVVALLHVRKAAPKDLRPKARMVRVMVASILLVMVACIGSRCDPGFAPIKVGPSVPPNAGVLSELGAQKVGFGKYRDLTVAELCQQDLDYVRWLQKDPSPTPNAANLIQYAKAMGTVQPSRQKSSFEPAVDQVAMDWNTMHLQSLDFGKFRGTSYNDMYEKHYSYIAWLRSQTKPSNGAAASLIFYADSKDSSLSNGEKVRLIGQSKVGFGKYLDLTIEELYNQHYVYVQWLCNKDSGVGSIIKHYADSRDGSLSRGEKVRLIGQSKVGFGKYRDLTVEELYNKDYFYVQWLCNQKDSVNGSIIKYYSKHMEQSLAPGELAEHMRKQLVGFGKHQNMSVAQLCQDEPDYVTWLRTQPEPSDKVRLLLDCVDLFDREVLHIGVVN